MLTIMKELKKDYNGLTDKEFELIFKRTMNDKYVRDYITTAFKDQYGIWLDEEAMKEFEEE